LEYQGDKFFKITGTGYDIEDMLEKPEYFKYEKGRVLEIKHMTPNSYLIESSKVHKGNISREMAMLNGKLIEKYALEMQKGSIFPIAILDYDRNGQEGRHRVMAVKWLIDNGKLGNTLVPVAVIKGYKPTTGEFEEYWARKWGKKSGQ
jgi:hypothetical protein